MAKWLHQWSYSTFFSLKYNLNIYIYHKFNAQLIAQHLKTVSGSQVGQQKYLIALITTVLRVCVSIKCFN